MKNGALQHHIKHHLLIACSHVYFSMGRVKIAVKNFEDLLLKICLCGGITMPLSIPTAE
jgi:hypothetical protein